MPYTKTTWVNGGAPAINAENLNKLEDGVEAANNHADTTHFNGIITTYTMSDGTTQVETDIQTVVELQETKTIFGGSF